MRILNLSGKDVAEFEEAEVVTEYEEGMEPVDMIFIDDNLCELKPADILPSLIAWKEALKPGGQMHIHVPAMEWACRELLAERFDPALFFHVWGEGERQVGFMLSWLRVLLDGAGLWSVRARTQPYHIATNTNTGQEYLGLMHYVVGMKPIEDAEIGEFWLEGA